MVKSLDINRMQPENIETGLLDLRDYCEHHFEIRTEAVRSMCESHIQHKNRGQMCEKYVAKGCEKA